jgi:adenylate cyclase
MAVLGRLIGLADDPADDEHTVLRKRVGVAAGYVTILAPLTLPIQANGLPVSWIMALGLSAYSAVNLIVLARTRNFQRFVVALIASGAIFVPTATWLGGGITGSSSGLAWGFLIPAYAILALGPRRATPWFFVYLGSVIVMVIVDPFVREAVGPPAYPVQLFSLVQNTLTPLAITFLLLRYTDLQRLAAEARVDELLTNAIPTAIASRLRRGERRIAEAYPETTVVFIDLVGFTPWAQRTSPARVVALLDALFTSFDELAEMHGVEKVKTIGDAWMGVAGAPDPRPDHAPAAVALARAMVGAVAAWRVASGVELEARIGLASGPVVGGVIGRRRLLFDLWGDTVNLASRMESSGVAGRINAAESTRRLLGDRCEFEERATEVKGLGRVTSYLVR